jgi:syntaxin-binding protein 1
MHIAEVIDGLTAYLNSFKARHKGVAALSKTAGASDNGGQAAASVADLGAVVKAMPEYRAQLAMYSQHNQLAVRCTKQLQAKGGQLLNQINDVEQTLATGYDQDGAPLKLASVLEAMCDCLMVDDVSSKLRLVLLLVATQRDLKPADLDRVCTMAGFAAEDRAVVAALQALVGGHAPNSPPTPGAAQEGAASGAAGAGGGKKKSWGFSSKSLFGSSGAASAASNGPDPFDYPSARFATPLKAIATELANDKLSKTDFPMVPGQATPASAAAAPQSLRRTPGWSSKKAAFTGGRNFIFVAGGVSHAEMKAAAEVSAATNKEVILGGTSILTPAAFLGALRKM